MSLAGRSEPLPSIVERLALPIISGCETSTLLLVRLNRSPAARGELRHVLLEAGLGFGAVLGRQAGTESREITGALLLKDRLVFIRHRRGQRSAARHHGQNDSQPKTSQHDLLPRCPTDLGRRRERRRIFNRCTLASARRFVDDCV